jgi:serralysin
MATAIAYTPINMDTGTIWYGNATVYTTTHIQIVSGSRVQNYFGTGFAYDGLGDVVGGTLKSTNYYVSNVLQYEVKGLAHSAAAVNDYLQANDPQGLLGYVLGGNDRLTGSAGSDVVNGYTGHDSISGGAGNDVLRGLAGSDTVIGGAGDDILSGGIGIDTVSYRGATSGITVSLAVTGAQATGGAGSDTLSGFEQLTGGRFSDSLTGNNSANALKGMLGADTLAGRGGDDVLTGAGGADKFLFNTALNAASNVDMITDFNSVADAIRLDEDIFTGLPTGALLGARFHAAPGAAAAHDLNDRIIYNSTGGQLYFDADGSAGGAAPVQFAILSGAPGITAADFFVVA